MEYSLRDPYWGTQFGSGNSWARISTSFILGGGTYTPLNPQSNASEYDLNTNLGAQFNNNPTFANLYPTLAQALCNTTWAGKHDNSRRISHFQANLTCGGRYTDVWRTLRYRDG